MAKSNLMLTLRKQCMWYKHTLAGAPHGWRQLMKRCRSR